MKNIFKFMGVALIAGSMLFVACGKDDPEENNNTNTEEATYTLTLKVNDGNMGSVAADPQKSAYKKGDQVTVTATANQGYVFASWADGVTANPRTITFDSTNITLTAQFVEEVTDHATITFGESTWEATLIAGRNYASYGIIAMLFYNDYNATTTPHIYMQGSNTVGQFTMGQNYYSIEYYNNDADSVEITYSGGETEMGGGWQPASFSQNVTAIDLNQNTIAFTAEAVLIRYSEYVVDPQTATRKNLSMDINTSFVAY